MQATIQLAVKFRAFGMTFGNVKKAWRVSYDGQKLVTKEVPFDPFNLGHVLYDSRGVFLAVIA